MKISKKQLISDLNYLLYRLDIRYSINSGGCCLIASIVSELLKVYDIPFKLKIYDDRYLNKDTILEEILSRYENFESCDSCTGENTCYHYALETPYGEINLEMKGGMNLDIYKPIVIDGISPQDINWIYIEGNWNDEYDINNTSLIIKIIKLFFYDKTRRLD